MKRTRYFKEFKIQAVEEATESGKTSVFRCSSLIRNGMQMRMASKELGIWMESGYSSKKKY